MDKTFIKTANLNEILSDQRAYFRSGATQSAAIRLLALQKLKDIILKYESRISQALKEDLGMSEAESCMCEIGMVLSGISYMMRHTLAYAKKQRVPTPLALYLFSEDRERMCTVTATFPYGGGCINDCVIHLATSEMGFSGMGTYHGKVGFDAFTHHKSIVDKKTWMDLPMRYQPYTKLYNKLIRMFLR